MGEPKQSTVGVIMRRRDGAFLCVAFMVLLFWGCTPQEPKVDVEAITAQPKEFVGSETCKMCHLEHYDSWKITNHSRMAQDVTMNMDAFIVDIDENDIKADFAKLEAAGKLKK